MLLLVFLLTVISSIFFLLLQLLILRNSKLVKNNYIAMVAGKSGGHIIPCLSYAEAFLLNKPDYKLIFFSTDSILDKKIIHESGISLKHICLKLDNFPRFRILKYPQFILQFAYSMYQSFKILYKHNPKKIITTGSHISIPVIITAYLLRIPIELFELNAVPGKAINLLSPLAHKINICFEGAQKYFPKHKTFFKEYPIKFNNKLNLNKEQLSQLLNLEKNSYKILALGGSQGSCFINNFIKDFIAYIAKNKLNLKLEIIHQAGKQNINSENSIIQLQDYYKSMDINCIVFEYQKDLSLYYQVADLCISRAGSGSLHELKYFNKRAIIIPLETADTDHQIENSSEWVNKYPGLYTMFLQNDIVKNNSKYFNLLIDIIKK